MNYDITGTDVPGEERVEAQTTKREDDADRKGIHLLYQVTVQQLANYKSYQWSVTNHTLLLYAGLVGIVQMLKGGGLSPVDRILLAGAAAVVCVGGLYLLNKLERSIDVREARLVGAGELMGEAFQRIWTAKLRPEEPVKSIVVLRAAVVIGALVTAWLAAWRL